MNKKADKLYFIPAKNEETRGSMCLVSTHLTTMCFCMVFLEEAAITSNNIIEY